MQATDQGRQDRRRPGGLTSHKADRHRTAEASRTSMRTTRNKPRPLARRAFSAGCIGTDAYRHQIAPDNPGRWRKSVTKEDGRHTRDYKDFWSVVAGARFRRHRATWLRVGLCVRPIRASRWRKTTKSGSSRPSRLTLFALGLRPVRLLQTALHRKTKFKSAGFDWPRSRSSRVLSRRWDATLAATSTSTRRLRKAIFADSTTSKCCSLSFTSSDNNPAAACEM
jgi:hypothetical protein